jgi:hypothetical protein
LLLASAKKRMRLRPMVTMLMLTKLLPPLQSPK